MFYTKRDKYTISNQYKYDLGVITELEENESKILLSDTNNIPEKNDKFNLPYYSLICDKFQKKNILIDNEQLVKIWKTHPKLRKNSLISIEYTKPNGELKVQDIEILNINLDKKNNTLGIKVKNIFINNYENYKPNQIYNIRLKITNIYPKNRSELFFWSKFDSKLLDETSTVNKFVEGETNLCNSCNDRSEKKNIRKIKLNSREKKNINQLLKNKINKRGTIGKNRLKKLSKFNSYQVKKKIKNKKKNIDYIPLKVKNKSYLYKGPFLNPNRYNPFTDPQSIYFGGIYLCSHALAKLDFPFCQDSPVYAVPPPQGF